MHENCKRAPALSDASTCSWSSLRCDRNDEEDDCWSTTTTCTSTTSEGPSSRCATAPCSPRLVPVVENSGVEETQFAETHVAEHKPGTKFGATAHAALLALLVVICGSGCQAPYEVLNSHDKGCIHLISFIENLFTIMMSGFALLGKRFVVPWHFHLRYAAMEVGYTVLMSTALTTTLPAATVIRMRSGGLVASMLLEKCILGRKHTWRQRSAVIVITIGLVATTAGGSRSAAGDNAVGGSSVLGIVCVVGALLCRAAGTITQEIVGRSFDGSFHELILVRCVIGAPWLMLKWPKIVEHAMRWSFEPHVAGFVWPSFWLLLIMNMLFDYGTKMSIMQLVRLTSSLTTTLALTIQRFVSFIFSMAVLSPHSASADVCLGAMTVLVGTVCYVLSPKPDSHTGNETRAAKSKNE